MYHVQDQSVPPKLERLCKLFPPFLIGFKGNHKVVYDLSLALGGRKMEASVLGSAELDGFAYHKTDLVGVFHAPVVNRQFSSGLPETKRSGLREPCRSS